MRLSILAFALLAACQDGSTGNEGNDAVDPDPDPDHDSVATGDSGLAWIEQAFSAPARAQDIVFVVDNSCSMGDVQDDVGLGMEAFLDQLTDGGVAWRVGVTSTDVDGTFGNPLEGRLVSIAGEVGVRPDSFDAAALLDAMIHVGTSGSGEEKGIAAAYMAAELRREGSNAEFFREGAGLHFVVISDEQDQSDQMRPELVTVPDFIGWLEGMKPSKPSVSFSSVICTAAAPGCPGVAVGTRYMDVTAAVGGILADIGSDTIAGASDQVASAVVAASGLPWLPLEVIPADPSTIEVRVDGVALDPAAWSYDEVENAVVLVEAAPDGSEVVVRFAP
jgi:hypothetical protein